MERVVLITGTSSGIGLETALAFARAGDRVVATMRDPSRASGLLKAASDAGLVVEVIPLDVTSDDSVNTAFAQVINEHGRLDVLVNNAGMGTSATLEELSIGDLQRSLEVNYLGVARMTKAALPIMRAAGNGHIIAVSSVGGVLGQPFNDAYCASKHALEGLYESLHPVAAALGVWVCIVEPGPVLSPFQDNTERIDSSDPWIARLKARYRAVMAPSLGKGQAPEQVAEVILAVADNPNPSLRYQTSSFTVRLIERKIADLSGDQVIAMTTRWLAPAGG
jgi:NAD(P)-dependent dehydrogenase (short-subunit alcohol dehydrogenase family)